MQLTSDHARASRKAKPLINRRSLFLILAFFLWEGFPAALVGAPLYITKYLVAGCILFLFFCYAVLVLQQRIRPTKFELASVFLYVVCLLVSFISNNYIFPQPISGWLFATYSVTPILLIVANRFLKFESSDIVSSLVIIGVLVSVLLIIDQIVKFDFLEIYKRAATTDISLRRIVLLKTETAFAGVILFCRIFSSNSIKARIRNCFVAAPVAYNLFVISESRLAISACLLATFIFVVFVLKGRRKFGGVLLGVLVALSFLPFVLSKYLDQYKSAGNYVEDDSSISFRLTELGHFYGYFQETYGLGFGIMSTGADKQNILSFSAYQAGYIYGSGDWGLGVADIGIFSALVQFGYIGIIVVLLMTFKCSWNLIRIGRKNSNYWDVAALGSIMLAFMLSPWPMNFFTLEWSTMSGNILWVLFAVVAKESKLISGFSSARVSSPGLPA